MPCLRGALDEALVASLSSLRPEPTLDPPA